DPQRQQPAPAVLRGANQQPAGRSVPRAGRSLGTRPLPPPRSPLVRLTSSRPGCERRTEPGLAAPKRPLPSRSSGRFGSSSTVLSVAEQQAEVAAALMARSALEGRLVCFELHFHVLELENRHTY